MEVIYNETINLMILKTVYKYVEEKYDVYL